MGEFLLNAYGLIGPSWVDLLWDSALLAIWLMTLYSVVRYGPRLASGRKRALVGLVLIVIGAILDCTDEIVALADVAVIGRLSPWHETVETVVNIVGLGAFLSAARSLIKYS